MNKNIYILTGKIQSGKTTRLFNFIKGKKSVDGILVPVIDGRRKLYHISKRMLKDFQADQSSEKTIDIGKYSFLKESFEWANKVLLESFKSQPEWLIIDELGKLELNGEGLHNSCKLILGKRLSSKTKIILVIRDYLVNDILEFYKVAEQDYTLMNLDS